MAKTITIPAPISDNLALSMRISGIVCLVMAAVGGIALLGGLPGGGLSSLMWAVLMPLMIGGNLLAMPGRMNELRAKHLKKRAVALEKGDPAVYVEKSSDPDLVRISVLFGILALFTFPIFFGPLAVLTGVAGLVKGHGKAMIGTVMGVLGLAVWGTLFYFFVLR
jgi:hypothetical protein